MHIIVIGAGIIGVSTAYLLAQMGHSVLVLESEPDAGCGCSFANGGQFSYSYTEPLASPSLLRQLPLLLLRRDSPLALKIKALPGLIGWSGQFFRNCDAQRMRGNMQKVLRLSLYSRRMLHQVQERERLVFDYRRKGKLHLYFDEAALVAAEPLMKVKNDLGCRQQMLNTQDCVVTEPALSHLAQVTVGGVFSPLDESGDTRSLTKGLVEACASSGRVQFNFGCTARSIQQRNRETVGIATNRGVVDADAYVVCIGADSARLCHGLGFRLPIQPAKGYSITLPAAAHPPQVSITDTRAKTVYSLLGERFRMAGFMEFAGFDRSKDHSRLNRLIQAASDSFPLAADYESEPTSWCGLRPFTPDGAPIIGATPYARLFVNAGHGMLGSTLAFGSAALIADIIDGRCPALDPSGFALERFE